MEPNEPAVEEVLVLRVVDEARRRRARRAVVIGLLGVLAAGGVAVGLTHRSAAQPLAQPTPVVGTHLGTPLDTSARIQILAVARHRYAPEVERGPHRSHVQFGRLTVRGDEARLQVNVLCVPLCGHGEELTLAHRHGSWQVTGAEVTWVS